METRGSRGEASERRRRAQQQGCGGQSGEIPTQRQCRPALTSPRGLSAHPPGRGGCWELRLGLRSDRRERTGVGGVNTACAPQLAGRESRKKSGAAEEARDFFLPLCFLVREERGLRALLKGAPEMGMSRGYQRGPQRRA